MGTHFLDCEFNGFDGELLSLALVREDGKSLCLEYPMPEVIHPWVAENVIPFLRSGKEPVIEVDRKLGAYELLRYFRGDPRPVIVCDWPADSAYLAWAMMPEPGHVVNIPEIIFQIVRCDSYQNRNPMEGAVQHNAWWDAMVLRHYLTGAK